MYVYDVKYCIDLSDSSTLCIKAILPMPFYEYIHNFPYFRVFTIFSTNLLKMNLNEKLASKENELSMIFISIMNLIHNAKFMIHDFIRISIKDLESSINIFQTWSFVELFN